MKDEQDDINKGGELSEERVAYLIAGYLRQTLSEEEHDELDDWMTASDENQEMFEDVTDPAKIEEGLREYDWHNAEAALERIKRKIKFAKPARKKGNIKRITAYSIAASIILIAGIFIVYKTVVKKDKEIIIASDGNIKPGGNKATLTLTNGKTIDLANAKNGLLDSTEGIEVLKTAEGQLSYEEGKKESKGEHILTTPAGGQYKLILPDGSLVILNSSSSLKYPVVFDDKERVVELTGEGYFEAHPQTPSRREGASKTPFIVMLKNGAQVEVVGTHFNIMAYDDEKDIEATLLEGKVRVGSRESGVVSRELVPGQQAKKGVNGEWSVVSGVDTNAVVAWKNGRFQFKDATIETIMRQVARWYDAEIVYDGKVNYHFNVTTIYRKEPLSELLDVLEKTNRVHFSVEGKRIMVRP
jgi:transmembrane sensor